MGILGVLGRIWRFIWYEESVASWVVNVFLAFLLIKFVMYPVVGLALGTSRPVVAVVSGSMEHDGSFDAWWASQLCTRGVCTSQADRYAELGISRDDFERFPFRDGFNTGDLIILRGASSISVGDVVVFDVDSAAEPIIHRVVEREDGTFGTKGDHNPGRASWEYGVSQDRFIGKAVLRIPLLGWVKKVYVCGLASALGRVSFGGCLSL